MKILKSQDFVDPNPLTEFVNHNGIQKEDILSIIVVSSVDRIKTYTIFYYGEHGVKEQTKSVFGWS